MLTQPSAMSWRPFSGCIIHAATLGSSTLPMTPKGIKWSRRRRRKSVNLITPMLTDIFHVQSPDLCFCWMKHVNLGDASRESPVAALFTDLLEEDIVLVRGHKAEALSKALHQEEDYKCLLCFASLLSIGQSGWILLCPEHITLVKPLWRHQPKGLVPVASCDPFKEQRNIRVFLNRVIVVKFGNKDTVR